MSEVEADEKESFLGHDKRGLSAWTKPSSTTIALSFLLIALVTSAILFVIPLCLREPSALNPDIRRVSTYRPVHDRVDLEMHSVQVNGSLFMPSVPSISRAIPNDVSDNIWEEIELTRVFPVTEADILKIGKDPSTAVKLEDDLWGLVNDAYATVLDAYHRLHCLNSLRQIAYGQYYGMVMGDTNGEPSLQEVHINHCADIIYQALVCSGNVNLIIMHWVETQTWRFHPDVLKSSTVHP
ncbi:hypothetical protein VPNG_09334 [Cytospora leucostoma]|uniref:DUF3328 domain-containing protein n=1 Tax=Cytospora leucostoma TaxID=1230097 RepID=A0A423VT44_9PEZI|nr:hypothetical protein VPNG_09334 [Cytospora leucostoma]